MQFFETTYGIRHRKNRPKGTLPEPNQLPMMMKNIEEYVKLRTPSLLVTATDDPFLSASCIPYGEARSHKHFHLEASKNGGHVGFNANFGTGSGFWLEQRVVDFLLEPVG